MTVLPVDRRATCLVAANFLNGRVQMDGIRLRTAAGPCPAA